MKIATVRQIQHHFKDVLSWIEDGEEVEVTRRHRVVARLIPPPPVSRPRKIKWPDFVARARSYCGDFVLSDEAWQCIRDAEERQL